MVGLQQGHKSMAFRTRFREDTRQSRMHKQHGRMHVQTIPLALLTPQKLFVLLLPSLLTIRHPHLPSLITCRALELHPQSTPTRVLQLAALPRCCRSHVVRHLGRPRQLPLLSLEFSNLYHLYLAHQDPSSVLAATTRFPQLC
jgi:hypothetical protein